MFLICCALIAALAISPSASSAEEWLRRIPLEDGRGTIPAGNEQDIQFLTFGRHSFGPDELLGADGVGVKRGDEQDASVLIAPFEELSAKRVRLPKEWRGQKLSVAKQQTRDAFWDQVLVVDLRALGPAPQYAVVEVGSFGTALPPHVRDQQHSPEQIRSEEQCLTDPIIPAAAKEQPTWKQLEAAALPLDFQKVLLASPNDASPAFAFQNGQWFTTWLSSDLPKWTKEDHWFAPALLVGDKLLRPAPLSAKSASVTTDDGITIPEWTLEWSVDRTVIRQRMFSYRASAESPPELLVEIVVKNAPPGARLALGMGRRPNCHYWDDEKRERTPISFFTLAPKYRRENRTIIDDADHALLESSQDFELEPLGPIEMLAKFALDANGRVLLRCPQTDSKAARHPLNSDDFQRAHAAFEKDWRKRLRTSATVQLPSDEWMRRIDIWHSQVAAITRVHYQNQERLSYGAYFYQSYFGPEEGWPIVALAQWGCGEEAKRQAEIMLSAENRSKENVHHQSRNGTAAWYTASVLRLTHDSAWLESVAPALIENADWTIAARASTANNESPLTRGLLPSHIYGGDIRDPATSLYASMVCCKGLFETADVFRILGTPALQQKAAIYETAADNFKQRLTEVMSDVIDHKVAPPFLPLALALPSRGGKNEGPYERLTETRLGNYWNLFAPSVLELDLTLNPTGDQPNDLLLATMQQHGGLWAALPRFNTGLDAAYSIGVLRELLRRSARDVRYRDRALAGLESFFLHAASRNGYTIPEVAGLFPDRLDRKAYEQLVRESPWNFGMYDADRYLAGHISFTEPLGAGAGEALWLIRDALVSEQLDDNGLADGTLNLLPTVPSEWFAEGKEIALNEFPTAYGVISVRTLSHIVTSREVQIEYEFKTHPGIKHGDFIVRVAPPGESPQDIRFQPEEQGTLRVTFSK